MTIKTVASAANPTAITTATAVLLLRDDHRRPGNTPHASLTATVQRARAQRPPHTHYRLELTGHGTHMILTTTTTDSAGDGGCTTSVQYRANVLLNNKQTSQQQQDEGFESDVDSLSIVSSDSINNHAMCAVVATETDSANGSACSDDSDDNSSSDKTVTSGVCATTQRTTVSTASYNLVSVLCYTDVTCPDLLVVLIDAGDTFVFRFTTIGQLTSFYARFTALKAVSQQRHYSTLGTAKFNLLHRTDTNGITHIEIARDRIAKWGNYDDRASEPSSIISLDTPGHILQTARRTYERRQRSLSSENILDSTQYHSLNFINPPDDKSLLRKVWNSAENLLDAAPIKPERRKRLKQRAPQPPTTAVTIQSTKEAVKSNKSTSRNMRIQFQNLFSTSKGGGGGGGGGGGSVSKVQSYQPFKYSDPKHLGLEQTAPSATARNIQYINPWRSVTVPRLLRSPPKVEARTFISHLSAAAAAAVSIRYVHHQHQKGAAVSPIPKQISTSTISNRLFGMSGKLKDFTSVQCGATTMTMPRKGATTTTTGSRWNSLGELTTGTNLKSVIKKEDQTKKSKEKKVTFSDFTTVKVL